MATIKATASITVSKERDISSVTRFYIIAPSTSAPTQPSGTGDPSGWSKAEPAYDGTSTNSLYIADRTIFTDGTASWSDVSKSSSYEAAKQAYNKAQVANETAVMALENSVEYIAGTQSASTRFWTGASTSLSELKDGTQITYWIPYASKSETAQSKGISASELVPTETITSAYSNTWLKLTLADGTQTGWVPVYYGGTTRLTTHYGAANIVKLTYREGYSASIPAGWWADAQYYANTSYTQYSIVKAGTNGIRGYTLIMRDSEDTWVSLYSEAYKGTGASKTKYTGGLLLGKILYSAGAGAQTSNSSLSTYYNYVSGVTTSTVYQVYPVDLRYSTNCGTSLVASRPVYIVGTMGEDGLFYLDDTWWTQTVPTTEDGKVYVYLGIATNTYQVWTATENPAYQYYDDEFRKLEDIATLMAKGTADLVQGSVDELSKSTGDAIDGILDTLQGTTTDEGVLGALTRLGASLTSLGDEYHTAWEGIDSFIRIIEVSGQPQMILGSNTSDWNVVITGTDMTFRNGDTPVAYINAEGLHVSNYLSFGNFQFYQRSNKHFSLKFIGGES